MQNIPKLLWRIDQYAAIPTADVVKGKPLTSLEIDGNFRSVIRGFESIPDIVTFQELDDHEDLDDLVDHKAMVYYVDKEIAKVIDYIDQEIADLTQTFNTVLSTLSNKVEVVTSDEIWNGTGLNKYVDHAAMLYYREFTSQASYYIDNELGSDANDGRSETAPWKTLANLMDKLPSIIGIYVTVNLRSGRVLPYEILYDITLVHSDLVFQSYGGSASHPTLTVKLTQKPDGTYIGPVVNAISSKVRLLDVNTQTPIVPASALMTYPAFGDDRYKNINDYPGMFVIDTHSTIYFHASEPLNRINVIINDGLLITGGGSNKIIMHSCYLAKLGTGYIMWPSSQHQFYEWNCVIRPGTKVVTCPNPAFPGGTDIANDLFWNAMTDFPVTTELLPSSHNSNAGFQKFPNGLIIQWGKLVNPDNAGVYTFPVEFDSILSIVCSYTDTAASDKSPVVIPQSMSTYKVKTESISSSMTYIAIGTAESVWIIPTGQPNV